MKNPILLLSLFFTVLCINAQPIENFESINMNIFSGGTNGAISVVANPDTAGNPSMYVGKMVRGFDGDPWAGWYATLPTPVNVTANRYVHLKLWKPRISPIVFKLEGSVNSGDVNPMTAQATVDQWEEFVFDMSVVSGDYVKIVLIPDFEDPLTLTEDITLYFDDLYVNDDPTFGSAPVQLMENFETIPLNYMLGGENDMSYMELIPNPDKTGVNLSPYVCHFFRDMDGVPWGGFWSNLPSEIDVTENKYVHVKVWKPRISPIRFKIEGGAAGTLEVESMYPQTLINEWEDMVFDFSEKTGTYPIIAFLPDFADPVGLTEDIDIYFDDIILNNDPNTIMPPSQIISVDMTESGMMAGEPLWIAGALGGIHGTWEEPGTNPNNEMTDLDGDGIYSITLSLPEGTVAFKFFLGIGWANGDPAPGGDRVLELINTMDVYYKWGVDGIVEPPETATIQWTVNMAYQIAEGNFTEGTDYLDVAGSFNGWDGINHHLESLGNGLFGITVPDFTVGETIEYKFRINGDWATSEFPDGGPNRIYTVANSLNLISVWYNDFVPLEWIVSNFTADATEICEASNIAFAPDTANAYVDSVLWSFPGGNPSSSTELFPVVQYNTAGIYDVSLIAYWNTLTNIIEKPVFIEVSPIPEMPEKPIGEELVCFDISSSSYTTNYENVIWDLDPSSAGIMNFYDSTCTIIWNESFLGEVMLKAKSYTANCESEFSETLTIQKLEAIVPDFSATPVLLVAQPYDVVFSNLTANPELYDFVWYFGNGDSSLSVQPEYTYPQSGIYTVSIVATEKTTGCSGNIILENYIFCSGTGIGDNVETGFKYYVDRNKNTLELIFDQQPDNLHFSLFNMLGFEHRTKSLSQKSTSISLNRLSDGMYLFVIDDKITGKVILLR